MSEFWAMAIPVIVIWFSSIVIVNIVAIVHLLWTTEKKVPWHTYPNDLY